MRSIVRSNGIDSEISSGIDSRVDSEIDFEIDTGIDSEIGCDIDGEIAGEIDCESVSSRARREFPAAAAPLWLVYGPRLPRNCGQSCLY